MYGYWGRKKSLILMLMSQQEEINFKENITEENF
jgi:hypothetical protein